MEDGGVFVIDGAAGDFPEVGHGVVGCALHEEDFVGGVEDGDAGCHALEGGIGVLGAEELVFGDGEGVEGGGVSEGEGAGGCGG